MSRKKEEKKHECENKCTCGTKNGQHEETCAAVKTKSEVWLSAT
jgi:hypothetical protein